MPMIICPHCKGARCKKCNETGRIVATEAEILEINKKAKSDITKRKIDFAFTVVVFDDGNYDIMDQIQLNDVEYKTDNHIAWKKIYVAVSDIKKEIDSQKIIDQIRVTMMREVPIAVKNALIELQKQIVTTSQMPAGAHPLGKKPV